MNHITPCVAPVMGYKMINESVRIKLNTLLSLIIDEHSKIMSYSFLAI